MTDKTKAPKTVNYTDEMTTAIVAAYTANPTRETVEELASKFGKTVRSITQKLVREKVYIKKAYTNKNGETPIKKTALVDRMMGVFGLTEAEATSLEKANKSALLRILAVAGAEPDASEAE